MKINKIKSFTSIMLSVLLLFLLILPVNAETGEPIAETAVYNDDGSSIICFSDGSKLSISAVKTTDAPFSTCVTAHRYSREATYSDAGGDLQWKYVLTGDFTYEYGKSSACINAYYTQEMYNSSWSFSDGEAIKSGNMAIGKGVYKLKMLFITVKTFNIDISLTCDVYGNVT